MQITILLHNIPQDPIENMGLTQNPDGLYDDFIATKSILSRFLVEVMGTDAKVYAL